MVLWKKRQAYKLITPQEASQQVQNDPNVLLLDVRRPDEYNNELGHAPNSILIPLQELEQRMGELEQFKQKTIVAICRSGNRSGSAAEFLNKHGFTALNMEGGMIRWNEEGLPVVRKEG